MGGRGERRLLSEVRPEWGRAWRSLRTKYHICQQFVEFGRVSVNTNALLGEESRDARLLADSLNDTMFKYTLYLRKDWC